MTVDFMQFNICSLTFESLNAMGANIMQTNIEYRIHYIQKHKHFCKFDF